MYEIIVSKEFKASHALRGHHGFVEPPHWHSWRCDLYIASKKLDKSGCAMDFMYVDRFLMQAISHLEGKELHNLTQFALMSPSSENIAHFIFDNVSKHLSDGEHWVSKVVVCEDSSHSAAFVPDELQSS
jgi:6-pyruvoyltetrahydropterin/6-carboxytetrahydropterin synthase